MPRTLQRPSQWVRKFVTEQIAVGRWKAGDFLPSEVELAQKLGVHRLTVNGVLKELVREGHLTRRRGVGTVVRDRGAAPLPARQAMVGVVLHHRVDLHTNPYYAEICETLRKRLLASGHFLLPLGSADEVLANQSEQTDRIRAGLAGFIFLGPVSESLAEKIRGPGQAAVFVGYSEGTRDEINISSDDEADSRALTERLIELGHRQIVHINAAGPYRMQSKLNGFLSAMEGAGIQVPFRYIVEVPKLEFEDGVAAMRSFCETGLPFTAVYGGNDVLALGALNHLQEIGKTVPDQVSVVGFDGIFMNGHRPRLTTMAVDRARMGRKAAEALLDLLEGRPHAPEQVRLSSKFVPGETLAAPPASAN